MLGVRLDLIFFKLYAGNLTITNCILQAGSWVFLVAILFDSLRSDNFTR